LSQDIVNILFIADIIGKPGLEIVSKLLGPLKQKYESDLCIANGENGSAGKGLTEEVARQFFSVGIDVITSGNHIWDNAKVFKFLDQHPRLLRPANYPRGNYGKGTVVVPLRDNRKVAVLNLQGRTFMYALDCPFRTAMEEIRKLKQETQVIIVDFHAEATAEKMAMGWYLDGKVSAVIGTHTHVQTADERILPQGTAYITDVGMTGPHDSVIGMKKEIAIHRFLMQTPMRHEPADSNLKFCGVVISVEADTGRARRIERLQLP